MFSVNLWLGLYLFVSIAPILPFLLLLKHPQVITQLIIRTSRRAPATAPTMMMRISQNEVADVELSARREYYSCNISFLNLGIANGQTPKLDYQSYIGFSVIGSVTCLSHMHWFAWYLHVQLVLRSACIGLQSIWVVTICMHLFA